jgi:hypothetical protein
MRMAVASAARSTAALLLAIGLGGSALTAQAATASTARWYIGTYTDELLVWDEASEQIVDRIQMRNRIPRNITLAENRDRLYVT